MGKPVSCSLCHAANYRRCPCPWSLPFTDWPLDILTKLKQHIKFAGRP